MRRGRGSAKANSGIIILGFIAFAISVLWIYLLAAAVVAIVIGLVRFAFKKQDHGPVQVSKPFATTFAPPATTDYELVANVEVDATTGPTISRRAIDQVFAAWAKKLPKSPKDSSFLIRRIEEGRRLIVRRDTWSEGRKMAWRIAPFRGRTKVSGPPIDIDSVDAWNVPSDLLEQSKYVCSCETCLGSGKVGCSNCGADGKVTCDECNGSGKVVGYTKNNQRRVLNCKACSGKGQVTCVVCTRGKVECLDCHGCKKLERWLDVDVWRSQDVQVEPDDYQRVFRWSKDGERATRQEMEADAFVVGEASSSTALTVLETPPAIPVEDRDRILKAVRAQLQRGERIQKQQLTVLEVPAVSLTYGIGDDEQTIELMGRRLLAPKRSVDRVFAKRSKLLNWTGFALFLMPLLVAGLFATKGSYYQSVETGGVIGSIALAALLVYVVLWNATLGRRGLKYLALVPVPLAAATVCAFLAQPSLKDAKSYLAAGNLDAAIVELEALGGPDDPDLTTTYADVRLRQLEDVFSASEAQKLLALIPEDLPQHQVAVAKVDALLVGAAKNALRNGDQSAAGKLLAEGSEAARNDPEIQRLQLQADLDASRACLTQKDWTCAFTRAAAATEKGSLDGTRLKEEAAVALRAEADEVIARGAKTKDLSDRVSVERAAVEDLELLEAQLHVESDGATAELTKLRGKLAKDEAALQKLQAAAAKKAAAAEAKRLKAEKKAAEKQRKREEAAQRREERESGRPDVQRRHGLALLYMWWILAGVL